MEVEEAVKRNGPSHFEADDFALSERFVGCSSLFLWWFMAGHRSESR